MNKNNINNQQVRLYQITKLLHIKGNNQQSKEIMHRMGKNFAKYPSDTGLILKIYNELK